MPRTASLGLAGLSGAGGAALGLETFLARQLEQQKVQEVERENRAREALAQQQLAEQTAHRELQMKIREADLQDRNKDREEGRRLQRTQISLARPMGSVMTPEEYEYDTKELGIPGSYFDVQNPEYSTGQPDDTGEAPLMAKGPEVIRFRGKEADLLKREKELAAQKDRDTAEAGRNQRANDANETRLMIAQLINATNQARNNAMGGDIRVVKEHDPVTGRDIERIVEVRNGVARVVHQGDSQLPGGMKAKQANLEALVGEINSVLTLGDSTGWKGVGPIAGPAQGAAMKYLGKGTEESEMLRTALDNLKADIAHEKYGSAFTATERGMLSKFAGGSNMNPKAAKIRLETTKRIVSRRLSEMANGKTMETATPITDLLAGSSQGPGANSGVSGTGRSGTGSNQTQIGRFGVTVVN